MPDLEAGEYLVETLKLLGPTTFDSNGNEIPLSWPIVLAYGQATSILREPWEFTLLIQMSQAYLKGKISGADVLSMPPTDVTE